MKRRAAILSLFLVAFLAALVATILFFRSGKRISGPMRHDVYVWQRAWTQPVRDAVTQHGTNFAEIVPLKAEISWKDKKPQLTRVTVDYATLAATKCSVGIGLRIGPYPGTFETGGRITEYICDVAAALVAEARSNRLELTELQIDFDCAESKLDGYGMWVEAVQRRVAPLPVTITALPSWLDSRAFKQIAVIATNYVLQVHSFERPHDLNAPFSLCDPRRARRAVERAGRIGVPFRVALPTYGYTFAFDSGGKFIGLTAEGPRPNWPASAQLREVSSNPTELSALVRDWTASRPEAMRGVIWYRLPTTVDNQNWRWPTLEAIRYGRTPR